MNDNKNNASSNEIIDVIPPKCNEWEDYLKKNWTFNQSQNTIKTKPKDYRFFYCLTAIICTLLLCWTLIYITFFKINTSNNFSITGTGTLSSPYILKDLNTGKVYRKGENGFWELRVSFENDV